MKRKIITIEALAGMVQEGFEDMRGEMNKRFDVVDEGLVIVDGRLSAIEMELMDIRKKLDNIVYRHEYEMLKDRVVALEKKLSIGGRSK